MVKFYLSEYVVYDNYDSATSEEEMFTNYIFRVIRLIIENKKNMHPCKHEWEEDEEEKI